MKNLFEINRFNHVFTSASARKEYEVLSQAQFIKFLRIFLIMLIIYGSYSMYNSFCELKDYKNGYIATAWTISLVFLWIFCGKLQKCISYLVILWCVPIFIPYLTQLNQLLVLSPFGPFGFSALFFGYFLGFFERIVSLRLPNFWYKCLYTVATSLMRGFIFGESMLPSLFVHILITVTGLILDFFKIHEDQKVFQSFYDYREELLKFKTLMVSGLPTKILILSKDLKQKLFLNERFQLMLDQQTNIKEDINDRIQDFLSRTHLDKQNLHESLKLFINANDSPLSTLHFLKTLKEKSLLRDRSQKILFNISLHHENPLNRKIFEVTVYSLLWDAQDAMAIILTDVTVRHQNLALKLADANKDKMLALISHELRTPLNGILGVVHLLEKGTNDNQTLQHLGVCKASGQLLLNLVNSILDLQHIRDNKFSLKVTRVNLNELLHEVYDLFRFQFEQKGLTLTLNAPQDLPVNFATDQNRLKQILINLIGNALKFTFEGGVEIAVRRDPMNTKSLEFRVADTGTGIKEEDQGKLFKMYGRLDQENPQTNTQGIGFGLEISNQLAKLLCEGEDGGIKFQSELGKGTTFYFSIKECISNRSPLIGRRRSKVRKISANDSDASEFDESNCDELLIQKNQSENLSLKMDSYTMRTFSKINIDSSGNTPKGRLMNSNSIFMPPRVSLCAKLPESPAELNDSEAPETPSLFNGETTRKSLYIPDPKKKSRILIVDDNPFNLLVARHLAENLGYDTETALNGKIAVDMLENNKKSFCAILMDLQMPVMDGYEATRILRKMMDAGEILEMPIIALSANDSASDKEKCLEIGMKDHISKPLDEKRLKKVLQEVMDHDHSRISGETKLTTPR